MAEREKTCLAHLRPQKTWTPIAAASVAFLTVDELVRVIGAAERGPWSADSRVRTAPCSI